MPEYAYRCDTCGRRRTVRKTMAESGRAEACDVCGDHPLRRVFTVPHRAIIRPSGYRLAPDDPKFGDFRRELELGELKQDATPLTFTPQELERFDHIDVDIPDDPERDRQLAQLVHQHWTNDLSDDTVRRRELEATAAKEGRL